MWNGLIAQPGHNFYQDSLTKDTASQRVFLGWSHECGANVNSYCDGLEGNSGDVGMFEKILEKARNNHRPMFIVYTETQDKRCNAFNKAVY
jgi:hypothetical protein